MSEALRGGARSALFGAAPLAVGDRVPDFLLPNPDGDGKFLYVEARGKPIVVLLARRLSEPRARAELRALARLGEGDTPAAHCFAITEEAPEAFRALPEAVAFPGHLLIDDYDAIGQCFGVSREALEAGPRAIVLDPNQRVIATFEGAAESPCERAVALVGALRLFGEAGQPRDLAPVLTIPRVLEPDFCRALVEEARARGLEETGVETHRAGQGDRRVRHAVKRRADHGIEDPAVLGAIHQRFVRRVLPEIRKAWRYEVGGAEGFVVGCYSAERGGYFHAHRDDVVPAAAHRRFAVTVNLNTGDFEGGGLRFAEYGEHTYVPGVGEAIVFSCSLLHEVMPVTRGERFALLCFLTGPARTS